MEELKVTNKDDIIMKLLHYFITEEDYRPIMLKGAINEIWLENLNSDLKIVRINTGYIHNKEQLELDLRRTKNIMKNIKRRTFTLNMNMLNIIVDAGENVKLIEDKDIETVKVSKVSDLKRNKIVNSLFPKIIKVSSKRSKPTDMLELTEEINKKTIKEEKKFSKLFNNKKPIITQTLIIINVLIFLLMINPTIYNYAIYYLGNNYLMVRSGEVYRLITSGFIHANIFHLFFNMYALAMIGKEIEKYYGSLKYLAIYFISMIVGSLFGCFFTEGIGIGASGAIFGLFGSLLFFSYNYRATISGLLRSPIMPTIVMNLLLSFMIPNVSASAHIGGLIGGFLTSMIVGIETNKRKNDKVNGIIVLILMILFLSFMIMTK